MSSLQLSHLMTGRGRRVPAASVGAGLSFLAASVGVVFWEVAGRVPHGWWLASFLGLVGGVAQLLLGAGHGALARSTPRLRAGSSRRQPVLWNVGTLLVPLGVLTDARLAVVLGSALLIAALGGSSLELLGARRARAGHAPRWQLAYVSLLALLSASVAVGTALAWDLPWI